MLFFDHYAWAVFSEPLPWAVGMVSFLTEVSMLLFVVHGMARHEASVVVPTYYISMTLLASAQGLCLFGGGGAHGVLAPGSAIGFATGVLLCAIAVGVMAGARTTAHDGDAAGGGFGGPAGGRQQLLDSPRSRGLEGLTVDAVHCSVEQHLPPPHDAEALAAAAAAAEQAKPIPALPGAAEPINSAPDVAPAVWHRPTVQRPTVHTAP